MKAAKEDPALFAAKDSEFHRRLAETTHNPLLSLLLDSIQDLMVEVRELVAKDSGLFEQVMPAHVAMLKFVAKRDARRARRAMRAHLLTALDVQKRAGLPASISTGAKRKRSSPAARGASSKIPEI
jgi:DNA-binding FadR family transcriptional regulator